MTINKPLLKLGDVVINIKSVELNGVNKNGTISTRGFGRNIGGEEYQTDGKLPLHYSMATGQSEHRFTIKAGEPRGFVMATEQRCDFP